MSRGRRTRISRQHGSKTKQNRFGDANENDEEEALVVGEVVVVNKHKERQKQQEIDEHQDDGGLPRNPGLDPEDPNDAVPRTKAAIPRLHREEGGDDGRHYGRQHNIVGYPKAEAVVATPVAVSKTLNTTDVHYWNTTGWNNNTNNITALSEFSFNTTTATIVDTNTVDTTTTVSTSNTIWTIVGPLLVVVVYGWCSYYYRRVPAPQYHRGALYRRQAERIWAGQAKKQAQHEIPRTERLAQIHANLYRRLVVAKGAGTGACVLSSTASSSTASLTTTDNEATEAATIATSTNNNHNSTTCTITTTTTSASEEIRPSSEKAKVIPTPMATITTVSSSTNTNSNGTSKPAQPSSDNDDDDDDENRPLLVPQELSKTTTITDAANHGDTYDEDDDVCPICLDTYEIGDVVMWSSTASSSSSLSSCSHVFHEDCIMQWLLEQRENECPSCRASFFPTPTTATVTATTTSSALSISSSSTTTTIPQDVNDTVTSSSSSSSSSSIIPEDGNAEEIQRQQQQEIHTITDVEQGRCRSNNNSTTIENEIENNHPTGVQTIRDDRSSSSMTKYDAALVDEEQEFTFMIMKGLVERVPSSSVSSLLSSLSTSSPLE